MPIFSFRSIGVGIVEILDHFANTGTGVILFYF